MRKVLFVVRTATTFVRLLDIGQTIFPDIRVQIVFTIADGRSAFATGLEDRIRLAGGVYIPWSQACELEFDLAISLSSNGPLHLIHAPLLLLSHGPGRTKTLGNKAGEGSYWHGLLNRQDYPLVIGLTNREEAGVFSEDAHAAAMSDTSNVRFEVIGDVMLDELRDAMLVREQLRQRMGLEDKTLVTLSSSWSTLGAFPANPQLAAQLLASLPADEYAVASILHPNIWVGHGEWQVRTWLTDAIDAGLILVPFEYGWQATTVMSDRFIGDHGSVTLYAQLLGIPTARLSSPREQMRTQLPLVSEMAKAPNVAAPSDALRFSRSCAERPLSPEESTILQKRFVANVGTARDVLGHLAYSLMGLDPPESSPRSHVPTLPPKGNAVSTWRVTLLQPDKILLATRYPGSADGYAPRGRQYGKGKPVFSALVSSLDEKDYRMLQACDIVLVDRACLTSANWHRICPNAAFAVVDGGQGRFELRDNNGNRWEIVCEDNTQCPYVVAVLGAYASLRQAEAVVFAWNGRKATIGLLHD